MRSVRPPDGLATTMAVLAGVIVAGAAGPGLALERYTGQAYDADGRLAYTETHWRYQRDGRPVRFVLYRCPQGEAFARKWVFNQEHGAAPNFDYEDGRSGYREGVRGSGARRVAYWQASRGALLREAAVNVSETSVIDAGFDAWVQQHWSPLLSQSVARAQFLVPSRARYLGVRVQRQASTDPDIVELRMGWDSWLGFAVPSVRLTYDTAERRLRIFEGVGTVRTADGAPWKVRIEFPPAQRRLGPVRGEIEAAAAAPLNGSCG